mgnify:CR=1 FL=1|jgi:hypothetical protein
MNFLNQYADVLKLVGVFIAIIIALKFKLSLPLAIGCGAVLTVLLYGLGWVESLKIALRSTIGEATLMVLVNCYLVTFLQRMMEARGDLLNAQQALDKIFNNRRINASLASAFIGVLPSPGAIFIAGEMVDDACESYVSEEDKTFIATYFRHIPESFMPTYSTVILAAQLSGVAVGSFILGMLPAVLVLVLLGYFFYLRKIPKDTGVAPTRQKWPEVKMLFKSFWSILAIILLIVVLKVPVYIATVAVIVLNFFIKKFTIKEILPFFISAFEKRLVISTLVVMAFKDLLIATNIITELPEIFAALPVPTYLIFTLIFFVGSIIAGATAIVSLGIPMAFAAIPGSGMPLMVLAMSCAYAGMQVSPTHICLSLACEHFKTDFGALIKRTLPIILLFLVVLVFYYRLLVLF